MSQKVMYGFSGTPKPALIWLMKLEFSAHLLSGMKVYEISSNRVTTHRRYINERFFSSVCSHLLNVPYSVFVLAN